MPFIGYRMSADSDAMSCADTLTETKFHLKDMQLVLLSRLKTAAEVLLSNVHEQFQLLK
jgi:hypothetical protein